MIELARPWCLALLAPVGLALLVRYVRRPAVLHGDIELFDRSIGPRPRELLAWLPQALRAAWLLFLVLALAGPSLPIEDSAVRDPSSSVALVVDASGSMGALAGVDGAGRTTRLDAAKEAAKSSLGAGPGPLHEWTALVAAESVPRLLSPPTLDRVGLVSLLDAIEPDLIDNRTNLGDALVVALETLGPDARGPRRIILFSDGAQNLPEALSPLLAARVAHAFGVPIDVVDVAVEGARSPGAELLRRVAAITGGGYVRADSAEALRASVKPLREPDAAPAVAYRRQRSLVAEAALIALALWLVETILSRTWLSIAPE